MKIGHDGLPIHSDATANIRPRLFLEGNYYVDLSPGERPTGMVSTSLRVLMSMMPTCLAKRKVTHR